MKPTRKTTQARLLELFHYDPSTGFFTRRIATSNSTVVGEIAGALRPDGYIQIRVDGEIILAHRLAWLYMTGEMPDDQIDHRDLNKANNAWLNLRDANNSRNQANRHIQSNNKTGYKGVSLHNGGPKFAANIHIAGKKTFIGTFATATEASVAYLHAANEQYGEFARAA